MCDRIIPESRYTPVRARFHDLKTIGFIPSGISYRNGVCTIEPMVDLNGGAFPSVGVGMLVVDQDRALLSLRRRAPEVGCWSILGGRVEPFETLETAAVREAFEEAGIDVVIERLLCVTDHIIAVEGVHWVSPAYLGRIMAGVPANREPEKTAQVAWFPLGSLPEPLTVTAQRAISAYLAGAASLASSRVCGDSG